MMSCSSNKLRKVIQTPNLYSFYKKGDLKLADTSFQILYATNRRYEKKGENDWAYTFHRSSSLKFGTLDIFFSDIEDPRNFFEKSFSIFNKNNFRIGTKNSQQTAVFPSTPYIFKFVGNEPVVSKEVLESHDREEKKVIKQLEERLALSKNKELIIYVHGFNNTFKDAALNLSEVWHFSGRQGVPLLFSWPAGSHGLFAYFQDRESGEFSIYHLKQLLKTLPKIKNLEGVHIIAHSRGADVVTTALREILLETKAEMKDPREIFKFKNLILAAPDLDFAVVGQRLIAERFAQLFEQITVYINTHDGALGVAQNVMCGGSRLGRVEAKNLNHGEDQILETIDRINFVNVKGAKGYFAHSYYRKHPGALSDIIQLIKYGAKPGGEKRPLKQIHGHFWELDRDYLRK